MLLHRLLHARAPAATLDLCPRPARGLDNPQQRPTTSTTRRRSSAARSGGLGTLQPPYLTGVQLFVTPKYWLGSFIPFFPKIFNNLPLELQKLEKERVATRFKAAVNATQLHEDVSRSWL